jgi:prophage regulatory protein
MRQASADRLLHFAEVSEITGMTVDTLRYLRHAGEGPPSFRLGRRVVFRESELHQWIADQAAEDAERRRARAGR